jgi:hypothetical protein
MIALFLLLLTKRPIILPTLDDIIGKDCDYTKPIPSLPDCYLTWPGKEQGKPKPPVLWI